MDLQGRHARGRVGRGAPPGDVPLFVFLFRAQLLVEDDAHRMAARAAELRMHRRAQLFLHPRQHLHVVQDKKGVEGILRGCIGAIAGFERERETAGYEPFALHAPIQRAS